MWTKKLIEQYRQAEGHIDLSKEDLEAIESILNNISYQLSETSSLIGIEPKTVFQIEEWINV
ncbi:MAG: hypothetical protein ACRBCI_03755 [Cellvibrionaceae bacterium]